MKIINFFVIFAANLMNFAYSKSSSSNGFFEADRIKSLPGLNFPVNFEHFSGYLNVSAEHRLFYYLVTSQNDTANNPLVFWFNGGPGCSSLYGLFAEMGPYLINPDGKTLRPNPNSWNKNASIVYLESPYWVGYSYSTDANETKWNDEQTSAENYEAIKQFMAKFPTFRQHRFFLTGESYAGVYIPTLAAKIVDGIQNYSLNFEGMAIGNGYLNVTLNQLSSEIYGYFHGFLDDNVWQNFTKSCGGFEKLDYCDPKIVDWFYNNAYPDPWAELNEYDIYEQCQVVNNGTRTKNAKQDFLKIGNKYRNGHLEHLLKQKILKMKKFFASKKLQQVKNNQNSTTNRPITPSKTTSKTTMPTPTTSSSNTPTGTMGNQTLVCESGYYTPSLEKYFNLPEVRKALHVAEGAANGTWMDCNTLIGDEYQNQFNGGVELLVKKVVDAGVRVLLYAGDTDMVCNFLLSQKFAQHLGLTPDPVGKYSWTVPGIDNTNAGTFTDYLGGGGLTFTTIRGAGHMVPQKKGPQIYWAIEAFLNNRRHFGLTKDNLQYMGVGDGILQ